MDELLKTTQAAQCVFSFQVSESESSGKWANGQPMYKRFAHPNALFTEDFTRMRRVKGWERGTSLHKRERNIYEHENVLFRRSIYFLRPIKLSQQK